MDSTADSTAAAKVVVAAVAVAVVDITKCTDPVSASVVSASKLRSEKTQTR